MTNWFNFVLKNIYKHKENVFIVTVFIDLWLNNNTPYDKKMYIHNTQYTYIILFANVLITILAPLN